MKQSKPYLILPFILSLLMSGCVFAQSWEFIKEEDGIRIYTRDEGGDSPKAYKGEATFYTPIEKVFALIEDVNNTEWWDVELKKFRVLRYIKNKGSRYYFEYRLPWPLRNRDLCVENTVDIDSLNGIYKISAISIPRAVPEEKNVLRIQKYRQSWTLTKIGERTTRVVLEGMVDPGGIVPDWVSSMAIIDTPLNTIRSARQVLKK